MWRLSMIMVFSLLIYSVTANLSSMQLGYVLEY